MHHEKAIIITGCASGIDRYLPDLVDAPMLTLQLDYPETALKGMTHAYPG